MNQLTPRHILTRLTQGMRTRENDPENAMWDLIHAQGGVSAVHQILALGVSEQTLRTRIKNGSLERVCHGVVAARGAPKTKEFQMMLGLLMAGPRRPGKGIRAALCGPTAAELHDLIDPLPDEPVHVLTSRRMHPKEGFVFHWTSRLTEDEVIRIGCLSVTSGPRTLIDCAWTQPYRAMNLFRRGLRRGVFTTAEVEAQINDESRQGRGGICKVREALQLTGPGAEKARSAMEDHFFDVLVEAGYPPPLRNAMVMGLTRKWQVDLFYPDDDFGTEVSPSWWHMDPDVQDKDNRKLWELREKGLKVLVVTELTTDGEFLQAVANVLGPPPAFPRAKSVE